MEPVNQEQLSIEQETEEGEKPMTYEKDAILYKRSDYLG